MRKQPAGRVHANKREQLTEEQIETFATTEKIDTPDSEETPKNEEQDIATSFTRVLAEIVVNPLFYVVGGLATIKIVSMLGEQVASIVIISAAPVVGLTLISKSDVGKKVQQGLEAKLPELNAQAEASRAEQLAARQKNPNYGTERPKWLGPLPFSYPSYLKGEVAGDYGFDPLGLSKDPAAFARNYNAELQHARWAMLAAVGALIPEALSMSGVDLGEPIWWKVGAAKLNSDLTLNYAGIEGFRIAGKQGIWAIVACQLALMGGPEYARYVGIKSLEPVGVFLPGDENYPGSALFDPFNLSDDPDRLAEQAVMEIKHGRIAMLTVLGYFVQAAVTRKGPLENLVDFLEDPMHNNIMAYL